MKIAFVCTGNTCRSPMAEYLLRELLSKRVEDMSLYQVSSFGMGAMPGDFASGNSIEVMKEVGIDLSRHMSRTANPETLEQDLVLTMEKEQRDTLVRYFPDRYIFTLKEFEQLQKEEILSAVHHGEKRKNDGDLDVSDPHGKSAGAYRLTRDEIYDSISNSLDKIIYLQKYFAQ